MEITSLHHPATYVIAIVAIAFAIFRIGTWVGSVNELKNRAYGLMDEIKADLKKILSQLGSNGVYSSNNPIQLNDLGKVVSSALAAKKWAKAESLNLIERARKKEEFEIYDLCFKHVYGESFKPSEEMDFMMRQVAYQHNINNEKVLAVLVIELRDCLLDLQSTDG